MKVLGLAGKAGAGKDHIYAMIDKLWPGTSMRVSFADGVREEVEAALSPHGYYMPALWEKPYTDEVRALLQWWGTDLRRAQDEDYWVDKMQFQLEDLDWEGETDLAVITDLRFANEADLVRNWEGGGHVAEVYAPAGVRQVRLGGFLPPKHSSEVIDFLGYEDGRIQNDLQDDAPLLFPNTADFLGLEPTCIHCLKLKVHPWHDNGKETYWGTGQ